MLNFRKIIRIVTHVVVAVVALLVFYYLKYRPIRNEYQAIKAVNISQKKQLENKDTLIAVMRKEYNTLARVPRYAIDQHLDRIKVKRNSSIEFVPTAAVVVADSANLNKGDSIVINIGAENETQRKHWWQFWKSNKIKKMKKEQLKAIAEEVFRAHGIGELYMTSDGQAFTKEHHAIDHARVLRSKEVVRFERTEFEGLLQLNESKDIDPAQAHPFDYEKVNKELLEDREFLISRYEALEDKKPAHDIDTGKLAEKVQELEKERFEK